MADLNHDILRKMSKTELIRVIEEMKSERDAAKRDVMRAVEERDTNIEILRQHVVSVCGG